QPRASPACPARDRAPAVACAAGLHTALLRPAKAATIATAAPRCAQAASPAPHPPPVWPGGSRCVWNPQSAPGLRDASSGLTPTPCRMNYRPTDRSYSSTFTYNKPPVNTLDIHLKTYYSASV